MTGRAANWEAKAKLAIEKGREELAREALMEKRRATEGIDSLQKEIAGLDEVIRNYQSDISQLEEKLTTAREKQRVLIQRHIQVQHKITAQNQIRRADASDALLRYEQFEARVERMEAEASLINYGRKPSLEEQFAQLERDEEIEKELEALKNAGKPRSSPASLPEAGGSGSNPPN